MEGEGILGQKKWEKLQGKWEGFYKDKRGWGGGGVRVKLGQLGQNKLNFFAKKPGMPTFKRV